MTRQLIRKMLSGSGVITHHRGSGDARAGDLQFLTVTAGDPTREARILLNPPASGSFFQHVLGYGAPNYGPPNPNLFAPFPVMQLPGGFQERWLNVHLLRSAPRQRRSAL